MRTCRLLFLFGIAWAVVGQEFDAKLSIHTIVREDIFAGFLENDLARLSAGEKKVDLLLAQRPSSRPDLLAWRGGAAMYRAVAALEAKKPDEFRRYYAEATRLFGEARAAGETFGTAAVRGGTFATLADRLPEAERQVAWEDAYSAYRSMHKIQEKAVDKLPLHLKGELLAGLAMTAQRTGKTDEATLWIDKILASMPNTPYAARAATWKSKPEMIARTGLACQSCHEPGRLAARQAALAQPPQ